MINSVVLFMVCLHTQIIPNSDDIVGKRSLYAPVIIEEWDGIQIVKVESPILHEQTTQFLFWRTNVWGEMSLYERVENNPWKKHPTQEIRTTNYDGQFVVSWFEPYISSWVKTKKPQKYTNALGYYKITGVWRIQKSKFVLFHNVSLHPTKDRPFKIGIQWPQINRQLAGFKDPILTEEEANLIPDDESTTQPD